MTDMEKQSDDDARLDERREVKGAWQVWEEQLRRVNRYYARFKAINQNLSDPSHYGADAPILGYEKDDVYSFFVHCYHLVDWLSADCEYQHCKGGKPCQRASCPECWVNSHDALRISRDLCIRVKHVRLGNDKTGKPRLITHGFDEPGYPYYRTHLIQWPDRATFDKKWRETQRENPDVFSGKTSERGFKQGYWNSGYEQVCWLEAYNNGKLRNAFEVATEAREDWKRFFVAPEADHNWKQYYCYLGAFSTDELYEKAFGPADHRGEGLLVR